MKFIRVAAVAMAVSVIGISLVRAQSAAPAAGRVNASVGEVVIGSADFPESQLIATIYAKALSAKGVKVTTKLNIGSREVYMPALLDGSVSVIPEYTGAVLSYLNKNTTAHTPKDVATELAATLPKDIVMLSYSNAEDTDVLAVTQATAQKYKLSSISDLAPVAKQLVLGGPPEWKTRHEGVAGLKQVYGLTFKSFRILDVAGPLTLSALKNGQIHAADMTSTDPAMAQDNLVALQDPKHIFAAQNIVPLVAKKKLNGTVKQALDQVSAALTTEDLITMNARLAKQESFDVVAMDWLKKNRLDH